jgi:anti-sigma-K factor RskA
MKMRQSLAQFEAAFHEQAVENRLRREEVRRTTAQRARVRRAERVQKHGTLRFFALVAVIVLTAVVVTVVMFETLARVAG